MMPKRRLMIVSLSRKSNIVCGRSVRLGCASRADGQFFLVRKCGSPLADIGLDHSPLAGR